MSAGTVSVAQGAGQGVGQGADDGGVAVTTGALPLEPAQVRQVLEIEARAFSRPWTLADFEWVARDEDMIKVGLWHGAQLAGYAFGAVDGRVFHLASLAIDEPWRRRGRGTQLLAAVLHRARRRGCRSCRLEVRRSNTAALELYRRFSFQVSGIRRRFYTGPVEDAWLLARELGAGPDSQSLNAR